MAHWSDQWVGLPYIEEERDCGWYAAQIQRDVFGHQIEIPASRRAGPFGRAVQISETLLNIAKPVDDPVDGDLVLMITAGRIGHIGVYAQLAGEPYVVHALQTMHQVWRTPLRRLPQIDCHIEGFYRCS